MTLGETWDRQLKDLKYLETFSKLGPATPPQMIQLLVNIVISQHNTITELVNLERGRGTK